MDFKKTVIILRGISGCGKSSLARYLGFINSARGTYVVCEADQFMIDSHGKYEFKPERLGECHRKCQEQFVTALKQRVDLVICSNTNTKFQDFSFYLEKAREFGYACFTMVVENYHGGANQHQVPEQTFRKQADAIKNSLKLI